MNDISRQEMDAKIAGATSAIDAERQRSDARFEATQREWNARFDANQRESNARFEAMMQAMEAERRRSDERFEAMRSEVRAGFDRVDAKIEASVNKVSAEISRWLLGTVLAIIGTTLAALLGFNHVYKTEQVDRLRAALPPGAADIQLQLTPTSASGGCIAWAALPDQPTPPGLNPGVQTPDFPA
jgi:hypothetical protein